jgi:DNA-binding NtrC family response regulator
MSLDVRALPGLRAYPWPGNVRELENLVHRAVLMADGPRLLLRPGAIPRGVGEPTTPLDPIVPVTEGGFAAAKAAAIAAFERAYLTRLMDETNGNVTQAARRAAKERRALGKLLKKYAIPARIPD